MTHRAFFWRCSFLPKWTTPPLIKLLLYVYQIKFISWKGKNKIPHDKPWFNTFLPWFNTFWNTPGEGTATNRHGLTVRTSRRQFSTSSWVIGSPNELRWKKSESFQSWRKYAIVQLDLETGDVSSTDTKGNKRTRRCNFLFHRNDREKENGRTSVISSWILMSTLLFFNALHKKSRMLLFFTSEEKETLSWNGLLLYTRRRRLVLELY